MKHLKLKSRSIIIVLVLTILNVLNVHAQNKNVSGTVLDNSGQPVIGASIVVVGQSKLGTVRRNRQTLWGGCTDANPKLLLNDT